MGYPCPSQDRPDRLPMAHPALHRPGRRDPLRPQGGGARRRRCRGGPQLRRSRRPLRPPRRPLHLRGSDRGLRPRGRPRPGPPGQDRPRRRHRERAAHRPGRAGAARHRARRPRRGGRRPPASRPRRLRLRRPLRLVRPGHHGGAGMSEDLGVEDLRTETVRQVAKLMAAAAVTAPKSGGQLFLAGKPGFMETVVVHDARERHGIAEWLRARGKERREQIWFRDAEVAQAVDAILFVGLLPGWYPPNYDCGACGYSTCAEFLHATKPLRYDSAELEFTGPTCNLRDIDLGIAIGSAAKTAAIHSIDCRCQTRVAVAARKTGVIRADIAVALSLSITHKAIGFDRKMPSVEDFDALAYPPTNTLPTAADDGARHDGARHRQHPRIPIPRP